MKEYLYSRNAVYEALRAQRREIFGVEVAETAQEKGKLAEILRLARERKIKVSKVSRAKLDRIHEHHQGVAAEVGEYSYCDLNDVLEDAESRGEPPFVLLLDSLQDPQNFGTLIRTAEAVGAHGIVIPLARTVEVTPAVVNASSGASEWTRVARANLSQAIDALKDNEIWVVGLDQSGAELQPSLRHLRSGLGLVVGAEGEGLRELTRKKCDEVVRLPMRGRIESLNAAVAGSVALYLAYLSRTAASFS